MAAMNFPAAGKPVALKPPPGFVLPDVSGPLKFDLGRPGPSVPPTTAPVGGPPPPLTTPSTIGTINFGAPGASPAPNYAGQGLQKPVITPPKPGPKTLITSGPSGIYGPAKLTDEKSAAAKDDATLWIGIGLLIYFLLKKP